MSELWRQFTLETTKLDRDGPLLDVQADTEALRAKLAADLAAWLARGNEIDYLAPPPEITQYHNRAGYIPWTEGGEL